MYNYCCPSSCSKLIFLRIIKKKEVLISFRFSTSQRTAFDFILEKFDYFIKFKEKKLIKFTKVSKKFGLGWGLNPEQPE